MFRSMYGSSLLISSGCTEKRCIAAGQMPPRAIEVTSHRPTAAAGTIQPRKRMFTNNSSAANSEMKNNRRRAGSRAWMSV